MKFFKQQKIFLPEHKSIPATYCKEQGLTTHGLKFVEDVKNVAGFGDAQHRGPDWNDYNSQSSGESGTDLRTSLSDGDTRYKFSKGFIT